MLIRLFATEDIGIGKFLNFLRLEHGASAPWNIETCDPVKWTPTSGSSTADIHIYIGTPVRLAIPWAKFNIYASDSDRAAWLWAKTDMDYILPVKALRERTTVLAALRRAFRAAVKDGHPPMLPQNAKKLSPLPKVGIITLTRNRKSWWPNMLQNVVKQDWPVSCLEWIIVDDGDDGERLGPEIEEFMEKSPGIMIRYVEMATPRSIGAKRNAGVEAAGDDVSVFVCMDDDDHYPSNSVALRVGWLNRTLPQVTNRVQSQIGYCSMIPMYDLTRYISAMSVAELSHGPADRASEATLVFTRDAWIARPFPDVSMGEGIQFILGREDSTVEMPPQDIIVSFIHSANTSSRRIPSKQEPNGCHYGFSDEFFKYVHHIGGGKNVTPDAHVTSDA